MIPIIMGIVIAPTFDLPKESAKEISIQDDTSWDIPDMNFIYFFMMLIWLFFLIRILIQIRKGTFKIQKRF